MAIGFQMYNALWGARETYFANFRKLIFLLIVEQNQIDYELRFNSVPTESILWLLYIDLPFPAGSLCLEGKSDHYS